MGIAVLVRAGRRSGESCVGWSPLGRDGMGQTGETCQEKPKQTLIHEELLEKQQRGSRGSLLLLPTTLSKCAFYL